MTTDPDALLIFSSREGEAKATKKKKEPELPKTDKVKALGAFLPPKKEEPTAPPDAVEEHEDRTNDNKKASSTRNSREMARNHNCAWHPWRKAYAICAFCNRPFCFEDIAEFENEYYCLEDIDNVTSTYERQITNSSHNMATVAGILLVFSFFLFSYFEYSQIIFVLKLLYGYGIITLLTYVNYNYIFVFCEGIFVLLGLVSGFLIFTSSTKGIYTGIISCIGNIAILSYRLVSTGAAYFGILDAVVFISLAALIYSKMTSTIADRGFRSDTSEAKTNLMDWPNAGKF